MPRAVAIHALHHINAPAEIGHVRGLVRAAGKFFPLLRFRIVDVVRERQDIEVKNVEPVGSYALALTFSDGHNTGIYSWDYLYELGEHHAELWDQYLSRMTAAGASRESLAGAPERPKSK